VPADKASGRPPCQSASRPYKPYHAHLPAYENKHKIVYVVDEKNHLVGSITDGDVRRWILSASHLDLNTDIFNVIQQPCFSMDDDSDVALIEQSFSDRITSIPLIDKLGHF
jgi:N-acetylneuraminate synthase